MMTSLNQQFKNLAKNLQWSILEDYTISLASK